MKNILEIFNIEMSEQTEWNINRAVEIVYDRFKNEGDMEKDLSYEEMTEEQKFHFAFREGYRDALFDILLKDTEGGQQ